MGLAVTAVGSKGSRRKVLGRAVLYVPLLLVAIQVAFPALVPPGLVYDYRLGYEYFRTNHSDLHLAIHVIRDQVRREKLADEDYAFVLGDSVAYSARTSPEESLGPYLEATARESGSRLRVFNLAQPSMQMGDIYTVILMLKEHGLSTRHLMINMLYGGFVARTPFPPAVFWLEDDLRRLDPGTYGRLLPQLAAARLDPLSKPPATLDARFDRYASLRIYPHIGPLAYRDFLWAALIKRLTGADPKPEKIDARPWTEKAYLATLLKEDQYQRQFLDAAFVLDESNAQVYFIDRIIAATPGDQVLFFLSPVNQTLMRDNVRKPGYQENLRRLDAFFAGRLMIYLNLDRSLPDGLFADHLHLTPDGNRVLAEILWQALETGGGR